MVKNRALKRDARAIKASTALTYPRAREQVRGSAVPVDPYRFFLGLGVRDEVMYTPETHGHLLVDGPRTARTGLLQRIAVHAASALEVHVVAPWAGPLPDQERSLQAIEQATARLVLQPTEDLPSPHTMLVVDAQWLLTGPPQPDADEENAARLGMADLLQPISWNARRAGIVVVAGVREDRGRAYSPEIGHLYACASRLAIVHPPQALFLEYGLRQRAESVYLDD